MANVTVTGLYVSIQLRGREGPGKGIRQSGEHSLCGELYYFSLTACSRFLFLGSVRFLPRLKRAIAVPEPDHADLPREMVPGNVVARAERITGSLQDLCRRYRRGEMLRPEAVRLARGWNG